MSSAQPADQSVAGTSAAQLRCELLVTEDLTLNVIYDDSAPRVEYFREVSLCRLGWPLLCSSGACGGEFTALIYIG